MPELKTCQMCKKDKTLSEFRFIRSAGYHSSICRCCETQDKNSNVSKNTKLGYRRSIIRIFRKLIPLLNRVDFDALIFELKEIYEANNNDS